MAVYLLFCFVQYDGMPPAHMILGAGMLSSSIAQFSAYPLALVRTRLQAQGMGGTPAKYTGMMDVLTKTYRNEGFRGLYKVKLDTLLLKAFFFPS